MKKLVQTYIYIILLGVCASCTSHNNRLVRLSATNLFPTLSSEDVTAFVMDENGYMWIGTSNGLNLFDGKNYRQYMYMPGDSSSLMDNYINFLFKDQRKRIWIGTNSGVCQYAGADRFKTVAIPQEYRKINQILENSEKEIFFVTETGVLSYNEQKNKCEGIFTYSSSSRTRSIFFIDNENRFWQVTTDSIYCYTDSLNKIFSCSNPAAKNVVNAVMDNNCIWSAGGNGLLKLDLATLKTTVIQDSAYFNQADIVPRNIIAYNHKIWLIAKKNIYSYNESTNEFLNEKKMTTVIFKHFSSLISAWYADSQNNLWFGFPNGGYTNLKRLSNDAALHHQPLTEKLNNTSIRALSAEGNMIWGLQDNNNVFSYDISTKKFLQFKGDEDIEGIFTRRFQHKINDIYCVKNHIWLASNSRLMCYSYKNEALYLKKVFRFGITNTFLGSTCTDNEGNIYAITNDNRMLKFSPDGSQTESVALNFPFYERESAILYLEPEMILVCTNNLQLATCTFPDGNIKPIRTRIPNDIKGITPICMLEDKQSNIWIGTNKGLYVMRMDSQTLTHIDAVPDTYISSIVENGSQGLWIGTHRGIAEYTQQDNRVTFYPTTINSQDKYRVIFNKNSAAIMQDSIYIFGHTKGCTVFTASAMEKSALPTVHLEKILINKGNQSKGIDFLNTPAESVRLNYKDNDITISFGAVCYSVAPQYSCYYKMEGFDSEWIESNENNQAIYSNLPAGSYTFKVKLALPGKENIFSEQQIRISVDKAPWLSTPAIFLYIIIIIGAIMYINRLYLHIKSDRLVMQMLQRDKEREHLTNEMNMNFFANISHEFRNPLTMISGPIIMLQNDKKLSTESHQLLHIVLRSINQMLKLIDQMLDFNKLESDALKMQVSKHDIANEIGDLVKIFSASTVQKNIKVEYAGMQTSLFVWLDKDKLSKILSNLFTNAFKHTPQNGCIKIGLDCIDYKQVISIIENLPEYQKYIHIYVQDSGKGIPEEQLNDIFKRYYQADNKSGLKYANWGTGIGLYYVKRLVELHHGNVKAQNVENDTQCTGAIFHVLLPADEKAYEKDARISVEKNNFDDIYSETQSYIPMNATVVTDPSKPHMLIVDDDIQASVYLRMLFEKEYNVTNKYDAESAIAALDNLEPDIILSDVVMNDMSGYEFCKKLKASQLYCHIPVILITAKSQIGEQVEGLNIGASGYVTKPFNPEYLKALVKSLLQNRDNIRSLLLSSSKHSQTVTSALSAQDMTFMNNLYQLMDTMMSQDNLNFNLIAEKLCMSRSKFNYKLKGLTGETPIHFFLKYKLNKAAELLKSGKYNVSEVADITGFGTVSHFSVSFKKYFGVTPSEYK